MTYDAGFGKNNMNSELEQSQKCNSCGLGYENFEQKQFFASLRFREFDFNQNSIIK